MTKTFTCDVENCGMTFRRQSELKKHKVEHVDASKILHCDRCNFTTLYRKNLKVHHNTHSDTKAFACPHKKVVPSDPQNPDSPLREVECEFKSNCDAHMLRHRKNVHSYKPDPRRSRPRQRVDASSKENFQTAGPSICPSSSSSRPTTSNSGGGSPIRTLLTHPNEASTLGALHDGRAYNTQPPNLPPNNHSALGSWTQSTTLMAERIRSEYLASYFSNSILAGPPTSELPLDDCYETPMIASLSNTNHERSNVSVHEATTSSEQSDVLPSWMGSRYVSYTLSNWAGTQDIDLSRSRSNSETGHLYRDRASDIGRIVPLTNARVPISTVIAREDQGYSGSSAGSTPCSNNIDNELDDLYDDAPSSMRCAGPLASESICATSSFVSQDNHGDTSATSTVSSPAILEALPQLADTSSHDAIESDLCPPDLSTELHVDDIFFRWTGREGCLCPEMMFDLTAVDEWESSFWDSF